MSAPVGKQYELECGHCGYQFTLELDAKTRSVKCAVCGGALTLAVAVPVEPSKPPKPAKSPPTAARSHLPWSHLPLPPPPPPPPAPPPVEPPKRDYDRMAPEVRAMFLGPVWLDVYKAFKNMRTTALYTHHFFVLYAILALFVIPLLPAAERDDGARLVAGLALVFVFPAVIHAINQIPCGATPRMHGGMWATASVVGLWVVGGLLAVYARSEGITVVAVAGLLSFVSVGLWLYFLAQLGRRLGDRAMENAARRFYFQFWGGVLLASAFGTGAMLAARAGSGVMSWCGESLAAMAALLVLRAYQSLLRTAAEAVARRAPVEARD